MGKNSDLGPSSMEHLRAEAKAVAVLEDPAERIDYVRRPRWIGYNQARRILDHMEDMLVHPQVHRMPCLLLTAETNNGKTQLIHRFLSLHPAHDNPNGDGIRVPALYVLAPAGPDESRFYNSILDATFAPYRLRDHTASREAQAKEILKRIKLRLLIIDDIHNMLAGSMTKQRFMLNVIRNLSTQLKISIVAAGTEDAFYAIHTDPQLSNRFEPMILPRWTKGDWSDEKATEDDYLKLLSSFEASLPLRRPSLLASDDHMASRLLALSEGSIGAISTLLKKAAIKAIQTGSERIDQSTLKAVDWTPPSEQRKRATELSGKRREP